MFRTFRAMAVSACLAPLVAGAQAISPLGSPVWSTNAELLAVESVRELSSGDLIVLDSRGPALYLVSRDGTSARSLVTLGAGPGEVQRPRGLWALTGDSTAVPDVALRRLLILGPSGEPVRVESLPDVLPEMVFGISELAEGTTALFPATWSPTSGRSDSVPILRWRLRTSRLDTLGAIHRIRPEAARRGDLPQPPTGVVVLYLQNDVLIASATGRYGVLNAAQYRVDIYNAAGTRLVRGVPYSIPRVPTTEAERRRMAPGMIPAFKPPFTENGHHLDPSDRAWIRRSRRAGDSTYTYDVFSPRGVHERTLVFPNNGRIVAVTARGVYAVDRDDDGFEHLRRYSLPRP